MSNINKFPKGKIKVVIIYFPNNEKCQYVLGEKVIMNGQELFIRSIDISLNEITIVSSNDNDKKIIHYKINGLPFVSTIEFY